MAGASRIIYGQISLVDGKFRIAASEEDVTSRKILRGVSAEGNSSTDLLSAADSVARALSPEVRPFSTHNMEALHEYSLALDSMADWTSISLMSLVRRPSVSGLFGE